MTKWIKLQGSVGSRAAEGTRRRRGGGGGGGGRMEGQKGGGKGKAGSLPKSLPRRRLSFSPILFINSPPSGPAQSRRTPQHHPGLYAVLSQLALEESTVGGIIIFHSTKAVEWQECQMHAGSKKETHHHEYRAQMILQRVCRSGWMWPVGGRSPTCLV